MKRVLMMGTLVVALVFGAVDTGRTAHAGDKEWAVAGKILAGIMVLDAITTPRYQPPPVYQPPVVYQPAPYPPVVYRPAPPPVVYRPAPPRVVYRPPVRYYHPRVIVPRTTYYHSYRPSRRQVYQSRSHGRRW